MDNDKISIEEWAEEILRNPSSYDSQSSAIKKSKEDLLSEYKFYFDLNLKYFEQSYEEKSSSNAALLAGLISQVSIYLTNISKIQGQKEDVINALRFLRLSKEIFQESMGKNLEISLASEKLGAMVIGLHLFGSSINQAKTSVGDWARKSKTTVESSYDNFYRKELWTGKSQISFGSEEARRNSFIMSHHIALGSLITEMAQRPFPIDENIKSSEKTKIAYGALNTALKEYFQGGSPGHSGHYDYFSLFPNNSAFEGIKKSLLAQD